MAAAALLNVGRASGRTKRAAQNRGGSEGSERQRKESAGPGRQFRPRLTCTNFMATRRKPFCSKRLMISPTSPRCTPSGLMAMKVRSQLAAMALRNTSTRHQSEPSRLKVGPRPLRHCGARPTWRPSRTAPLPSRPPPGRCPHGAARPARIPSRRTDPTRPSGPSAARTSRSSAAAAVSSAAAEEREGGGGGGGRAPEPRPAGGRGVGERRRRGWFRCSGAR